MNKKNLFQLVGLAAALTAGAVELPLTNPSVPFVKKTDVQQKKSKPVFDAKGKQIIFGSKVLKVFPSGFIRVSDSGRPFAKMYIYGTTPYSGWCTNSNTGLKAPAKYGNHLGIDTFTADEKTQTFTVTGKVAYNKKTEPELTGTYKYTISLLPEEKVRLALDFDVPEKAKRGKINMIWVAPRVNSYIAPGKKESKLPPKGGQHQFWKPALLQMHTGLQSESFHISTKSDVTVFVRPKGEVAFHPNSSKKEPKHYSMTVEFDPLTCEGQAASGAADLRLIEAMDPGDPASRNLMRNPYFAQGLYHIGFHNQVKNHLGSVALHLSQENPKFGKNCLSINMPCGGVDLATLSLASGSYTYSFYARSEQKSELEVAFYNHAYKLYGKKYFSIGKEWKRYQTTVRIPDVSALRVRMSAKGPAGAKMYLDGVQVEAGTKATAFDCSPVTAWFLTSAPDDFIRHGDKIQAKIRLSTLKEKASGKFTVTVRDTFGTLLFSDHKTFNFKKNENPEFPLSLDGKIPDGVHTVQVSFEAEGKKYNENFRFSVMPFLKNQHKHKNVFGQYYNGGSMYIDVYPGLENYFRRSMYIGSGADPHQPYPTPAMVALLKKYNREWTDTSIGARTTNTEKIKKLFPKTNPVPGRSYYFLYFSKDRFDWWRGNGAQLPDHKLCGGWTPEFRQKVVDTVAETVKKAPMFRVYEIGCEWAPDSKTDPYYAELVIAAREGVKKAYPKAMFCEGGSYNMDVGGGVREIDTFLTQVKGRMPIEVIHTHAYTHDILALETNLKALVDVVENKHGHKNVFYFFGEGMHYGPYEVPVWGLESCNWDSRGWCSAGPLSYDIGWTEKHTAAYFMRSWLIFMTRLNQLITANSSICNRPGTFELDVQMRPRVYQKIPNTLSLLLGNAKRFVKDVSFARHTKCLIWEDGKSRPVVAVWYQEPSADLGMKQGPWATAKLPKDVEIFDMMGAKRTTPKDGRFPVSVFPFFFRGQPGQVEEYAKIFADAEIVGDTSIPFRTNLELTSTKEATLTLTNFKAKEVSGSVTAGGKTTQVKLAPLGTAKVKAPLSGELRCDRLAQIKVPYEISSSGKTVAAADSFTGIAVKRFTGDWNRIPSFAISNFDDGGKKGADFSAKAQLAWDKNNFYIRVTVTDDKFVHKEHPAAGNRWENDSLQIFIDTRCSAHRKNVRTFDEDDYAYTFCFDKGKPKLFRWRSPDIQLTFGVTAPKDMTIAEDIPCKFTKTKSGYIYETAIPSGYMLPARMENNYAFGFALYVNDRDDGKKVKQSLTMTPAGTSPFNRPYLYPLVLLTE